MGDTDEVSLLTSTVPTAGGLGVCDCNLVVERCLMLAGREMRGMVLIEAVGLD